MSLTETPIAVQKEKVSFSDEYKEFYQYCNDFYNEEYGIYPIASEREIGFAIDKYIKQPRTIPLEFDSIDREMVRKIIEPNYVF